MLDKACQSGGAYSAAHLREQANDEDAVEHDEAADEEVEGDCRVAVAPKEGHETAEAEKHHNLHIQEPLVVLLHVLTAWERRTEPLVSVSRDSRVLMSAS